MAKAAGCSHTTVSAAFSSPRLPSWGVLELLVERMGGDRTEFHRLWLAAGSSNDARSRMTTIAGRSSELAVVRRHLEGGTGLLMVTGEAGIGKTAVVSAAIDHTDSFVAVGHCLPLFTAVPLLPVADVLRALYAEDDGLLFKEALADCPPYVAAALPRILPELTRDGFADFDGASSMLHLFSAIATVLDRIAEQRPVAAVFEDLHWADSATLDLVQQVAARSSPMPVVGTWRDADGGTSADKQEWLDRIRRRRDGTAALELAPLTIEETAAQLRLITGRELDPERVARIHSRSAGHPLFTEQLAHVDDADLPKLLADLLDRRLGVLEADEWKVARALGCGDRGLPDPILRHATGLPHEALTTALRRLHARRLVASEGERVRLGHPLLAEAVRRRAMPGEAREQHRRLAEALAAGPDRTAAEVAVHWQSAGDRHAELTWRVAAAREAARRRGPAQEAAHWLRALDLWPAAHERYGTPPIDRTQVTFRTMHALWFAGQPERVDVMAASLLPLVDELAPHDAGELLAIAGRTEATFRSLEEGLRLVERAVAIYTLLGPSTELVLTLRQQARTLKRLGRLADAAAVLDTASHVNSEAGDVDQGRLLMAEQARHAFGEGRRREALAAMEGAVRLRTATFDPVVDATLYKYQTELLLDAGASAADVVDAARRGLALAQRHGIDTVNVGWLWYYQGIALARSGDIAGAALLIDPLTDDTTPVSHQPLDLVRADLDVRRGSLEDARKRIERALTRHTASIEVRTRWCGVLAELELWEGRPDHALNTLLPLLDVLAKLDAMALAAPTFLLAGRAAADIAGKRPSGTAQSHVLGERVEGLKRGALRDPMAGDPCHRATWVAEVARLNGAESVLHWTTAATEWDRLHRPHDAAYCRWRGSQAALATGQNGAADRMLKRAAKEAHQHVPLREAIARTAARGV